MPRRANDAFCSPITLVPPRTLAQTSGCKLGTNGVSVHSSGRIILLKRGIYARSSCKCEYRSSVSKYSLARLLTTSVRAGPSAVANIPRPRCAEDLQRDNAIGQCPLDGLSTVLCGLDRTGLSRRGRMVAGVRRIRVAHPGTPSDFAVAGATR